MRYKICGLSVAIVMGLAACGDETSTTTARLSATDKTMVNTPVAPKTKSNPLRNAYYGETHMHTSYSLDAYLGGTRLTPSDAYRFAKGEAVTVNGAPFQRQD